tara:strand:+ start:498 stop:1178 length:681 start_codon:yes stop_codon:yes gene_type:complete
MKKLLIKDTQKEYNSMLNAYDVATERKLNVHCFHISIVLKYGLKKDQFVDHITKAIEGLNLVNNPILNDSAITRFKSLNTNKKLLEMFIKSKPKDLTSKSVKEFLKSFNIDSQELLQVACYDGGIFSKNVLHKDAKKVQEIKKKKSKKPSGKTNQTFESKLDASNLDDKNVEEFIVNTLKGLEIIKVKKSKHYKAFQQLNELQSKGESELYNIQFSNYKKNGIKAS